MQKHDVKTDHVTSPLFFAAWYVSTNVEQPMILICHIHFNYKITKDNVYDKIENRRDACMYLTRVNLTKYLVKL